MLAVDALPQTHSNVESWNVRMKWNRREYVADKWREWTAFIRPSRRIHDDWSIRNAP
jgi:hypothetical protein